MLTTITQSPMTPVAGVILALAVLTRPLLRYPHFWRYLEARLNARASKRQRERKRS
ncbi:hypothetical protein [Amycolatopsis sp. lyj-23]|uniref:hypothetical protein n=1 Tax=Amycolatopsis sp. lyj-23 TaxID=2789283 RepID=UPI00397C4AAE